MIRRCIYGCLALFVGWIILFLLQLWFAFFSTGFFLKLTLTLTGAFFALLAIAIVVGQYTSEQKMKDDDYLE